LSELKETCHPKRTPPKRKRKRKRKRTEKKIKENVRFTTSIQQLYNNPSYEGGSHILGPTLM
jgi:hypothetical protein